MPLLIIAVRDKRRRFHFLADPLCEAQVEHEVFHDKSGFLSFLFGSLIYGFTHRFDKVVILGGDLKNFIWYLLARLRSAKVFMRLGGDPILARESLLSSLAEKRKYFGYFKYWINHQLTLFLIKRVDHFIVVNDEIVSTLNEYRDRVTYSLISQYVDIPELVLTKKSGANDAVRLLTVTNLNYLEKAEGVCQLIQHLYEYCQLQESPVKLVFQIVGSGRHEDLVRAKVNDCNGRLGNLTIEFVGQSNQVPKYLSAADVFVYASQLDATPNVLLEAKSFALPVITNNYGPLKRLFLGENTRNFFNLSSAESFIKVFRPFVNHPQIRVDIGRENREEAITGYSLTAVAKKYKVLFLSSN